MSINKIGGLLLAGVLALGAPLSGYAQNTGAKQDIKGAGHDVKQAAKKTGKAVKKGTKKVTNKVAKKTRQGAAKVEDKTK
jgi:predicted small secreted protein